MTDLTRVYAFDTLEAAATEAGRWKARQYNVALVGPTDAIRLAKLDEDPTEWESGTAADWYLVIASKAPVEVLAAKKKD